MSRLWIEERVEPEWRRDDSWWVRSTTRAEQDRYNGEHFCWERVPECLQATMPNAHCTLGPGHPGPHMGTGGDGIRTYGVWQEILSPVWEIEE